MLASTYWIYKMSIDSFAREIFWKASLNKKNVKKRLKVFFWSMVTIHLSFHDLVS